ncbi:MAG: selenoneine synthase SenA [Betaproteobacteria bacterium]
MSKVGNDAPAAARSAAALAAALIDAREYTKSLYAHLTLAQRQFPYRSDVNPPEWEMGHIGWFQEFWCRRQSRDDPLGARVQSRIAAADTWWNSSTVPHASRWSLPLPDRDGVNAWLDATLADTLTALAATSNEERYYFELALVHEDMHAEALLMTLQTLALPLPPGRSIVDATAVSRVPAGADQHFPGGMFDLGVERAAPTHRFVFDNEKWAHPIHIDPFAMATHCVTNAQYAAFVDAGGYARSELWTDAGRAWLRTTGATHPMHWRREAHGWSQRRFATWVPLETAATVMHVNAFEAEAFCCNARRRLPTEAEWEYAARHDVPGNDGILDHTQSSPTARIRRPGMAHLLGNVWEWTASPFLPYPEFAPDPYADYSAPWFGDHRVLRGGSFATRSRLVHPRFRNFYRPERADPFAGFRTCALQHDVTRP